MESASMKEEVAYRYPQSPRSGLSPTLSREARDIEKRKWIPLVERAPRALTHRDPFAFQHQVQSLSGFLLNARLHRGTRSRSQHGAFAAERI